MNDQPTPTEKAREIAEKIIIERHKAAEQIVLDWYDRNTIPVSVPVEFESLVSAITAALTRSEEEKKKKDELIRDFCDDDTKIRDLARPFLTPLEVDGDSYGVPTPVDIVETLTACIKSAREETKSVRKQKEYNGKIACEHMDSVSALTARLKEAEFIIRGVFTDLPSKRDWLNPALEHMMRLFLTASTPVEKE